MDKDNNNGMGRSGDRGVDQWGDREGLQESPGWPGTAWQVGRVGRVSRFLLCFEFELGGH